MPDDLTPSTVELLQTLIRNRCVNDGTLASGNEIRSADVIESFLGTTGHDVERFDAAPGRTSVVARIEGTDPTAPSLCLMGHTDVVPANPDDWSQDPFGGEVIDGEVWGRGAVDMLNLTSSMAVAFRYLATSRFRPRGDLIYFAVADEEAGSSVGARWMAEHHREAISADYVLTENGGLHSGPAEATFVSVNVAEKGVAWRRLRVRGESGHGSMPFKSSNALVTAAAIIHRLAEYRPAPRFHELWRERVDTLGIDSDTAELLMDPDRIDEVLAGMPLLGAARNLHACTHTTVSPNAISGLMKTNVIPDVIDVEVDIRTMPGETTAEVDEHLRAALGDLYERVEVGVILNDAASISATSTPLWDSLERAVTASFPSSRLTPQFTVGFTDARIYREMGSVAYGAGLFDPQMDAGEYGRMFHGRNERVGVESLRLTTQLWLDVVYDLLAP
ncbi:MAG: M20/M25/M40 family metallo-hydrolase [Acidimicrobiales bacterium]